MSLMPTNGVQPAGQSTKAGDRRRTNDGFQHREGTIPKRARHPKAKHGSGQRSDGTKRSVTQPPSPGEWTPKQRPTNLFLPNDTGWAPHGWKQQATLTADTKQVRSQLGRRSEETHKCRTACPVQMLTAFLLGTTDAGEEAYTAQTVHQQKFGSLGKHQRRTLPAGMTQKTSTKLETLETVQLESGKGLMGPMPASSPSSHTNSQSVRPECGHHVACEARRRTEHKQRRNEHHTLTHDTVFAADGSTLDGPRSQNQTPGRRKFAPEKHESELRGRGNTTTDARLASSFLDAGGGGGERLLFFWLRKQTDFGFLEGRATTMAQTNRLNEFGSFRERSKIHRTNRWRKSWFWWGRGEGDKRDTRSCAVK